MDALDILLIDFDSIIPNLALMKLSKYHKERGDNVGLECVTMKKRINVPKKPDKIYISGIFRKNRHQAKGISMMYPDSEVLIGGVGLNHTVELPDKIEMLKPDYDLYYPDIFPEDDYSLGFTTRGCDRACYFCYVYRKEGGFRFNRHPETFYDERFDKIKFLDNNVLFDRNWFHKVMDWCKNLDLSVEWNQGLDCRLLKEEDVDTLVEMQSWKPLKFAFDNSNYEKEVMRTIDWFKERDFNTRANLMFYVYLHNDTFYEDAVARAYKLRERNVNPYLMINIDLKPTPRMMKLKQWVNNKNLFWGTELEDFLNSENDEEEKRKSKYDKRMAMVEEHYKDTPTIEEFIKKMEKDKECEEVIKRWKERRSEGVPVFFDPEKGKFSVGKEVE